MPTGLLFRAEVEKRIRLKRSAIYRLLSIDKSFPKPIMLGSRRVAWREHEIEQWIESRPRSTAGGRTPDDEPGP